MLEGHHGREPLYQLSSVLAFADRAVALLDCYHARETSSSLFEPLHRGHESFHVFVSALCGPLSRVDKPKEGVPKCIYLVASNVEVIACGLHMLEHLDDITLRSSSPEPLSGVEDSEHVGRTLCHDHPGGKHLALHQVGFRLYVLVNFLCMDGLQCVECLFDEDGLLGRRELRFSRDRLYFHLVILLVGAPFVEKHCEGAWVPLLSLLGGVWPRDVFNCWT